MLKRIELKNFRSFGDFSLELDNINILIGGNGAGKSNFISIFTFLNYISKGQMRLWIAEKGGFDNIIYKGIQENDSINIEFYFDSKGPGLLNIYSLSLKATENDYIVESEDIGYWDELKYPAPKMMNIAKIADDSKFNLTVNNNQKEGHNIAYYIDNIIQNWKIYHFDDVSPNSNKKREQDIEKGFFLQEEGDNIAAFLYFLKTKYAENYQKIVEAVKLVAPYFKDFILEPEKESKKLIKLRWMEKESIKEFSASLMSDGTLRFLCLAALLLQPYLPEVVIIDEPELGLHPLAITILSELVKKASTNSQIIMATQSVTLLNNFKPEDVIVIDKEKEGSSIKRLDKETLSGWLDEYTLGELWEGNYIGGRY